MHQKAIADVIGRRWQRHHGRIVDSHDAALRAAIEVLVEQPAIPARQIDGLVDMKVHAVLHASVCRARRTRQVDDAAIERRIRVDLAMRAARQQFVRTDPAVLAEHHAVEHGMPRQHFESRYT
ncbi:hypothetical protein [Caballeronia sp. LZ001]|uniref:hypothetical protein n=1 Tax=Caballeronia sp. LZ001 TaxID=3038553 RepID=UPI0028568AB5|nr:hypothetical protein [Caballeronia sp. LZ001]MDR5806592.1 hypothetical protein [Caballeronia sp. LZ001]